MITSLAKSPGDNGYRGQMRATEGETRTQDQLSYGRAALETVVRSCTLRCLNSEGLSQLGKRKEAGLQGPSALPPEAFGLAAVPRSHAPHFLILSCPVAPTSEGRATFLRLERSVAVPPRARSEPAECSLPEVASPRAGDTPLQRFSCYLLIVH